MVFPFFLQFDSSASEDRELELRQNDAVWVIFEARKVGFPGVAPIYGVRSDRTDGDQGDYQHGMFVRKWFRYPKITKLGNLG